MKKTLDFLANLSYFSYICDMKQNYAKPKTIRTGVVRKRRRKLPRWLVVLMDWWNDLFYLFSGITLILVGAGLIMWGLSALGFEKSKIALAGWHIHVIDLCVYVYLALTLAYTAFKIRQWFMRKFKGTDIPRDLPNEDGYNTAPVPTDTTLTEQPNHKRMFLLVKTPTEDAES